MKRSIPTTNHSFSTTKQKLSQMDKYHLRELSLFQLADAA